MKPLTTNIYSFPELIQRECLYVDKTAQIKRLISAADKQYFLSRPRRFGKSLLVSTLKAIFQGRRELFYGLAIDQLDYDWKPYPVIHLDMGSCAGENVSEVGRKLLRQVKKSAKPYGIHVEPDAPPEEAFDDLIQDLASEVGPQTVVLVDEYDKPLLGHLGQPSAKPIQSLLKKFYGVIKTTEADQRFAFITGVSKFSKVSVFSDLNNLTELTMSAKAATLLGYTQEELESNFPEYIDALAEAQEMSREEVLQELRVWYNGYTFEENKPRVYNPVSTMKCLDSRKFENYWFETGTPTFLVELLKHCPIDLNHLVVPKHVFSAYDVDQLSPIPLLFQTGYLTIKGTEKIGGNLHYQLDFPNQEVAQSFSYFLAEGLGNVAPDTFSKTLHKVRSALAQNDMDTALDDMRVFFADIPYDITLENEKYYQSLFYVLFRLIGLVIEAETRTDRGRIDAVVLNKDRIFVIEFKLHDTAEKAMEQIRNNHYALKYKHDGRPITLVGVSFDAETRNIDQWLMEEM
jgi:hypothetical protein